MARTNAELLAFNRGVISPLALARVDIKRVALSAEVQTNFIPRVLGPMSLRPGLKFLGGTHLQRAARHLPFVFSITDTAIIELTDLFMRIYVDDVDVSRPTNSGSSMANGEFTTDLSSWTDLDEGTFTSSVWATGGYMSLTGDGTLAAIREQHVTLVGNEEYALRVEVTQHRVILRVGSTSGGDDYIRETVLGVGTHSLTFTSTNAAFYVRLFNRDDAPALVTMCAIEGAGFLGIPTPWGEADLQNIQYVQSGDIVFVACAGVRPMKIERRSTRSWSVVDYTPDDGPFLVQNLTPLTMTPSGITAEITLTASKAYFRPTNVGSLFSITSNSQARDKALSAANVFSDPVRISGLTAERDLHIATSGTWVATLTLQRSVGEPGDWVDVTTYTSNQNIDYNDGFDNQIIYYRLGIKTGDYTSGAAAITISSAFGSITGIVRVTAYTSDTVVTAIVLTDLGAVTPSTDWAEGAWSPRRGYPSAVEIHEGRLWWAGKDNLKGSGSDAYYTFGNDIIGDAGPIFRTIGSGPVDTINWLVSADYLIMGGQGSEFACRSSSIDEPLTPTNFKIKAGTTIGSAAVHAFRIDGSVVFVDRSGARVHELTNDTFGAAYSIKELTALTPEIGRPTIVRTAVQRKIDTRIHCVRSDGKVALLIFDKVEEVACWVLIETDGLIEDVVVLPTAGEEEDYVYYVVQRTVAGVTYRFLEKWAFASQCEGGTVNHQADSYVQYSGVPTQTLTGLTYLEGEEVVVWGDGVDLGTYTVALGSISLSTEVSEAIVGRPYTATFKSTKLAYAAQGGSALTQNKRLDHLGLVLKNTHYQGLQYGDSFDTLDDLPLIEQGTLTPSSTVWSTFDFDAFELNGTFNTDSRLCLQASAPRPCTILAAVISMSTNEKL